MKLLHIPILLVALSVAPLTQCFAADKDSASEKAAAPRAIPFRGKIASVDAQAKTLKVGERTFQLNADTKIVKAGKPASLAEATVGEDVGGSYREGADKKLNVVSLRIGAKPEDKK
jgi:hypothetical protein